MDQKRFTEAAALIERIPARERTPAMVAFSREISLRSAIAQARASFDAGNRGQALASMRALAARSDLSPATRGEIASTLYEMGDGSGALAIVRAELAKGIPASAQVADYAGMASVLARAGSDAEAGALVTRLDTLAGGASDRRALQDLRNGLAAQRADRLRLAEQLAPAYDVLAAALQSDPEDPVLLGSLARLYAAGDMHGEATAIYDRLLARSPGSVDLTLQAANVAIGGRDFDRAHALLDPVLASGQAGAQAYFMAGQLARAEGDTAGAIDALEQAQALRAKELGVASAVGGGLPAAAPAAPLLGPNPFRSDTAPALPPASPVAAAR